jgi:hypothetical protein
MVPSFLGRVLFWLVVSTMIAHCGLIGPNVCFTTFDSLDLQKSFAMS